MIRDADISHSSLSRYTLSRSPTRPASPVPRGKPSFRWVVVTMFLLFACVGASVVLTLYVAYFSKEQYGIVCDAGSTHTDATLFRWPGIKLSGTGDTVELSRCHVHGGSIFHNSVDPSQAGEFLSTCLKSIKRKVPKDLVSVTPIYLAATGTIKLLPKAKAKSILHSVKSVFQKSGLKYEDGNVQIISEREEGMNAWITVNFLLNKLGQFGRRDSTVGSLNMATTTTQITFETWERGFHAITADSQRIILYGYVHIVFTHSFFCWGTGEAVRRYKAILILKSGAKTSVDDPCFLRDNTETIPASEIFDQLCTTKYPDGITNDTLLSFHGTGDSDQCEKVVDEQFNVQSCNNMFHGRYCFDPKYVPKIKGEFVAVRGFAYFARFFDVLQASKERFFEPGRNFCSISYSKLPSLMEPIKYSKDYCYQAHLFSNLLLKMYGFNTVDRWKKLTFEKQVNGMDVGWDLGYMIKATQAIPVEKETGISLIMFLVLFIIFAINVIICLVVFYIVWNKKRM